MNGADFSLRQAYCCNEKRANMGYGNGPLY